MPTSRRGSAPLPETGQTITTQGAAETAALGLRLGRLLGPGNLVALIGDLGTGKTSFAQGVIEGLGVAARAKSPTFAIVHQYRGAGFPVFHLDVYRLKDPAELESLDFREMFFGPGVALVEWADRVTGWLPQDRLDIHFDYGVETDSRVLTFVPTGQGYRDLLGRLLKTNRRGLRAEDPGN